MSDFYKNCDLHLHIPEGAIPKDGPSAGVSIATAIVSILSGKKVKHNLAMTGEITLTGNVLPIGGLAEKLIAAKRAKITNVIIPHKNEPNLSEIPEEINGAPLVRKDKEGKDVWEEASRDFGIGLHAGSNHQHSFSL